MNKIIINKKNEGKINDVINDIRKDIVKYQETLLESEEKYEKEPKNILEQFKRKESNLIIIIIHSEDMTVYYR